MNKRLATREEAKTGVIVDLYKIDPKEFCLSDNTDNTNILYGKTRFYFLYECMYWYAIEVNSEYFAFDISGIISAIRFDDDSDQKERNMWLLRFIKCLESSEYFIDFESSVKRCLSPMLLRRESTSKYKFMELFLSIVKWIKRFHLKSDYSLF